MSKKYKQQLLKYLSSICTLAVTACFGLPANAQSHLPAYPSRLIKLVVPYPPGGGADTLARLVATGMSEKLAQPVVIENKPGGNTAIATEYVANQPADGYTLLYVASAFTINPSLYKLRYSTTKDFAPVALIALIPFVIETNTRSSIHSVSDLIAEAKKRPGQLSYATYGTGSPVHLAAELFQVMTDTKLLHVPYKGSAPGLTDLMGGQVDLAFGSIEPSLQLMRNQKIRPIAVTTSKRIAAAPEIPTVSESGVPGFETIGWNGIVSPANTPKPIVDRLNEVINQVIQEPAMMAKLSAQGVELEIKTPDALARMIDTEINKWDALVKRAGVKVD
jgi:tripartite-type tricarboxylate transporter receptor subunit TctC